MVVSPLKLYEDLVNQRRVLVVVKTSEQVGDLMRECMKEIPSTQVEFFVSRGLIRFKAGSILIVTTDQVPQSTSGNEFHKGYGHIDNQTRHLIRL